MQDPCQSLWDEWNKAVAVHDEVRAQQNKYHYHRRASDEQLQKEYDAAEKKIRELHAKIGKCLEVNGLLD